MKGINKTIVKVASILFFVFIVLLMTLLFVSDFGKNLSLTSNVRLSTWENLPITDANTANGNPPTETSNITEEIELLATLKIEALDLTVPIAKSNDWALLTKYAVPFYNSDLPTTSEGNFSIAAYRGNGEWCSYCYFFNIKDLDTNDIITVEIGEATYTYQVTEKAFDILTTQSDILERIKNQSTLTLITCASESYDYYTVLQAKLISSSSK